MGGCRGSPVSFEAGPLPCTFRLGLAVRLVVVLVPVLRSSGLACRLETSRRQGARLARRNPARHGPRGVARNTLSVHCHVFILLSVLNFRLEFIDVSSAFSAAPGLRSARSAAGGAARPHRALGPPAERGAVPLAGRVPLAVPFPGALAGPSFPPALGFCGAAHCRGRDRIVLVMIAARREPVVFRKNSQRHSTFTDLVNGLACGGDGGRLSGGDPGEGWGGCHPPRRVDSPALADEVEEAAAQQRLREGRA